MSWEPWALVVNPSPGGDSGDMEQDLSSGSVIGQTLAGCCVTVWWWLGVVVVPRWL